MSRRDLIPGILIGFVVSLFFSAFIVGWYRGSGTLDSRIIDGWQDQDDAWRFKSVATGSNLDLYTHLPTPNATLRIVIHELASFRGTWYGRIRDSFIVIRYIEYGRVDSTGQIDSAENGHELLPQIAKELAIYLDHSVIPQAYLRHLPHPDAPDDEWYHARWTSSRTTIEIGRIIGTIAPGLIAALLFFCWRARRRRIAALQEDRGV